ncbi:MAG: LysR family transcriptional regulator [Sarcina sp.]
MKLQDLEYFKKLAETKNFTKTARELFTSQPTISTSVKNLEIYFDTTFIERKKFNNEIVITPNGAELLKFIKKIDCLKDDLKRNLDFLTKEKNILSLGLPPIYQNQKLIDCYKKLFRALPIDKDLSFIEMDVLNLQNKLLNNELDFALTYYVNKYEPLSTLRAIHIETIPFYFYIHSSLLSTCNLNSILDGKFLEDKTFITLSENTLYNYVLHSLLHSLKIKPKNIIHVENLKILEELLLHNAGIAVISESAIKQHSDITKLNFKTNFSLNLYLEFKATNINSKLIDKISKEISNET